MEIRTLGTRSDLMLLGMRGEVIDHGDHVVARSPRQPGYFWGNLLVYPEAPRAGDFEAWTAAFREAFADLPEVRHQTFQWDEPTGARGEPEEFEAAGFRYDVDVVLSARAVHPPPRPNPDLEVRPLASDADWAAALTCQVECRDEAYALEPYTRFKQRAMAEFRELVAEGRGQWFGAFLDGELAGDLGIFAADGLARFQTVGTRPSFRRRGVCGTLVHRAGAHALAAMDAEVLVMVADPGYHAARVYESVGFEVTERQAGLCRRPAEDLAEA